MDYAKTYHDRLSMGVNPPSIINVVIEGPKDNRNLYEFTTKGHILVSQTLDFNIPYDFGTIPRALDDNQKPLKSVVLSSEPSHPKSIVRSRPIGLVKANSGKHTENILVSVALHDNEFSEIEELDELNKSHKDDIEEFIEKHKKLSWDEVKIDWKGEDRAQKAVNHASKLYNRFKYQTM